MPWDGKRLLGHVETIQLTFGVTDKTNYIYTCIGLLGDVIIYVKFQQVQ